jgi:hypothetical protein
VPVLVGQAWPLAVASPFLSLRYGVWRWLEVGHSFRVRALAELPFVVRVWLALLLVLSALLLLAFSGCGLY